jgi:hypothetical protein
MHSFRDNGTDGWGLAPACWGLSGKEFRTILIKKKKNATKMNTSLRQGHSCSLSLYTERKNSRVAAVAWEPGQLAPPGRLLSAP